MRDVNRIKPFLDEVAKQWERVPDWRFGQLMCNFLFSSTSDPFFFEEDVFVKKLKEFLDRQGIDSEEL